jgi:hypothetical protein
LSKYCCHLKLQNHKPNLEHKKQEHAAMADAAYVGFGDFAGFSLRFTATQAEPAFAKLFLASGGSINAAAGPGPTDFAITGSKTCSSHQLKPNEPTEVEIPLSNDIIGFDDDGRIVLNSKTKINVAAQRTGAAINGTIVSTFAGAGAAYLSTFLKTASMTNGSHFQIPLVYSALASHSATVGCSMARVVDASGEPLDVHFVDDHEENEIAGAAEAIVDAWAQGAWNAREKHIVYKPSPTLTKTVAKVPVGVNDKGYDLAHDVIAKPFPFSHETLNSLLEHAIGVELAFDPEEQRTFLQATSKPGVAAAEWMQTIAAACSTAANYIIPYRADGRTTMNTKGSGFEAVESWRAIASPVEANDCDGSAIFAISMLTTAAAASKEEKSLYPYVRAASNAMNPYYTVGVSVVGAASAEASGSDAHGGGGIAGHAIALVVPNIALLRGLDGAAAVEAAVHGPATGNAAPEVVAAARFGAIFSEKALGELPTAEKSVLAKGTEALETIRGASLVPSETENVAARLSKLQVFAIEGTTPASPILYVLDKHKRERASASAKADALAFEKTSPNIGRSVKMLHVGGHGDGHRFYHDMVELTISFSHPLLADAGVRALGRASSQFSFIQRGITSLPTAAGATPRQLAEGDFAVTPLHVVGTNDATILDFSRKLGARDMMPSRGKPMQLSASQSKNLKASMSALATLNTSSSDEEFAGHAAQYILSYATLVNNPASVKHFVDQIAKARVASIVDSRIVRGLTTTDVGADGGLFCVVSAVIAV